MVIIEEKEDASGIRMNPANEIYINGKRGGGEEEEKEDDEKEEEKVRRDESLWWNKSGQKVGENDM